MGGRVAGDLVVGTGKLGVDIVVGTGKVATDAIMGTGKAVVGTGQLLKTGTEEIARGSDRLVTGTLKGIGKAPRRITNIFSQGDVIQEESLKDTKEHLRHVEPGSGLEQKPDVVARATSAPAGSTSPKRDTGKSRKGKQRRNTDRNFPNRNGLGLNGNLLTTAEEEAALGELSEMELFVQHLQGMDPDKVKRAISDNTI